MILCAAALGVGCESISNGPQQSINELELREGLIYLRGETSPYTGVNTKTNPRTGQKYVFGYRNGLKHGTWEEWYNARQQFSRSEWNNGRLIHGTTWRRDGTESGRVINGNGSMVRYSPDGTNRRETLFRNGRPVAAPPGATEEPTPPPVKAPSGLYLNRDTGQPFEGEYHYIKDGCRHRGRMTGGRRDGLIRVWYSGGAPLMEADYSLGKINGRFVEWYPNGQRMVDAIFQLGQLVHATSWQLDGAVASTLPKGSGKLMLFHADGRPRRVSVYENGLKVAGRSQ